MPSNLTIALVGDYNESVPAHQAIPIALRAAAIATGVTVKYQWVPTQSIESVRSICEYKGIWCVPASPYKSMDGALLAIRYAREIGTPFLGTCGGFQHTVLEYARNVLNWADADHAESSPDAPRAVISPLECALVDTTSAVRLYPGSRIAAAYGAESTIEGYRCRYGLNPKFRTELTAGPMRVTADDVTGEVRAIELDNHRFFVATLFQPERAALHGKAVPLAKAFLRACVP